jgi:hypothetical protein
MPEGKFFPRDNLPWRAVMRIRGLGWAAVIALLVLAAWSVLGDARVRDLVETPPTSTIDAAAEDPLGPILEDLGSLPAAPRARLTSVADGVDSRAIRTAAASGLPSDIVAVSYEETSLSSRPGAARGDSPVRFTGRIEPLSR